MARVAPLPGVDSVDVPVQETEVKLLENAERVRPPVHQPIFCEDDPAPGPAQKTAIDLVGENLLPTEKLE